MKIAIIGNIHANLPALEAVLSHAKEQDADVIWNTGDLIGYNPAPNQVIQRLREENVVSVLGDFDRRVLKFKKKKRKWRHSKRPERFLAYHWAHENLSQDNRVYLENLPMSRCFHFGSLKIVLVHGSPKSIKECLTPDTKEKRFKKLAKDTQADVILCGTTHFPFHLKIQGAHFINPGSVGQPTNGHPQASYALLDCDPRLLMIDPEPRGNFKLQFFQVAYDVEATVHTIRQANLPEAYAQLLLQSQDLDTVLKEPETWGFPETKENKWWVSPFKTLRHRKEKEDRQFETMIQIAKVQGCNVDHLQQAEHLALRLFDELQPLHRLGPDERYWLRCGALLHDLGKPQGNKKHHKKARDMILNTSELPFNKQEEKIISLIARYHRKAWPKQKHDLLTSLSAIDQRKVTLLSSILRVADGLDSPRRGNVQDVKAHYSPQKIIIKCQVKKKAKKERKRALGKGELMEFAFDRDLYIEWHKL